MGQMSTITDRSPGQILGAFCCVVLCNGGLAVPFGLFWLNNPDVLSTKINPLTGAFVPVDCWANPTLTNSPATAFNYDIQYDKVNKYIADPNWVNVTSNFLVWFEWGFILSLIFIGGSFFAMIGAIAKSKFLL